MTKPARAAIPRWQGLFLAAFVAALVMFLGAGTASAATVIAAQTHVGARTLDAHVTAGPYGGVDSGQRRENSRSTYDSALGRGAEEDLASPRLAPEYGCDGVERVYDALVLGVDVRTVAQIEASGPDMTAVPVRSQSGAASEGSVGVSGFVVAAKAGMPQPGGPYGLPKPKSGKGSVAPEDQAKARMPSDSEEDSLFKTWEGKCAHCGDDLDPEHWTAHHEPRHADGGTSDDVYPVHPRCHWGPGLHGRSC